MTTLFKNATVYQDGGFIQKDFMVADGVIVSASGSFSPMAEQTVDLSGKFVFPGFVDVHVHLREPGFVIKETIATGTAAAAHGGYTCVCAMPNLSPPPDGMAGLTPQLEAIQKTAVIPVLPFGTITVGQQGERLADLESMAPFVAGFSDDGRGVQSEELMRTAMRQAKALGRIISAHCEQNDLLEGGYIHKGTYAAAHGHKGICSESEWKPIERDIRLAKETGCAYHVCHISAKESVELIRKAKAEGVNITCETAPHYLVLDDSNLQEDGRFKMNPPLRDKADREALVAGLCDGTIDMIATDHAPHTAEEKSKGLAHSLMGVVGLETAFPVLYTKLVKTGIIPLEKLIERMAVAPRKRFQISGDPGFTVWDLSAEWTVDPTRFLSKGRSTPFAGERLFGKCVLTVVNGKTVYQSEE